MFLALLFLFAAWYVAPFPSATAETVFNWVCYVLAGAGFLFALSFWTKAAQEDPRMGRFLKTLFGGGEEGWRYAFQSVFALGLAGIVHLVSVVLIWILPENTIVVWVASGLQVIALVPAVFCLVLIAFSIDSFLIKPVLRNADKEQTLDVFVDTIRKRATIVIPILIALVALIVELSK